MEKILTIIIPTYNMEKYLDKCLTSLIIDDKVLMKQLEVLVIIDGAKDRSSEIAHTYQDKYPGIFIVIDKENGNYGSCINRGLKEATGKYIKILDADDSYDSVYLVDYMKLLSSSDVELIVNDFDIVNSYGKITRVHRYHIPSNKVLNFHEYATNKLSNLEMHSVAYKRSIFEGLNYHQTEGISYTDQEWVFLPVTRINGVIFFNKPLYKYLVGREGQTVAPDVYARSIMHTKIGLSSMMVIYEAVKSNCPNDILSYLQRKLSNRVTVLYTQLLLFIKDNKMTIELDNDIKTYSMETWAICENITYKNIPFVKIWRKNNYVLKLPLKLRVYLMAKGFYNKLR